jgi:lipid A biosynthesis acyltransferase
VGGLPQALIQAVSLRVSEKMPVAGESGAACPSRRPPSADQKMNDGIPVPFFGRPAMTAPALAVLALRFDCDVLPARVERLAGARFRLTIFPPLPLPRSGEPHADAAALMARVNATLEAGSATDRSNGCGCTDAGRISRCHLNPLTFTGRF